MLDSLKDMPRKIQWVLDTQPKTIQAAAERMVNANSFLFLGRHVGYPVALEGALKLKEIAYTFTEGFAAGELMDRSRWWTRVSPWCSSCRRSAAAMCCTPR